MTIHTMINGLPGNVARTLAAAARKDERLNLVPFSLTGMDIPETQVDIDGTPVTLVKPDTRDKEILSILEAYPGLIAVDFTHPSAVNANAEFYARNQIPFVMGTTGGDRAALEAVVTQSSRPSVIAPNMAKQIVGFQAMMEYGAATFPGLFKGYSLKVVESHQQGKADTSGTAKAVVSCFNGLGVDFKVEDIQKVRDPEVQEKEWGIPKEHLGGHGWHTYTLTADDGSALFEFKHNINGREIYPGGTFDAVVFLDEKIKGTGGRKKLYSMIDVMTQANDPVMTPMARLILILFGLAYLISPVDIIPDLALPFVGWIDDGLVLWCIYYLIRHGDLPWFMFKRPGKKPSGPKRPQQPRKKTSQTSRPRGTKQSASKNSAGAKKTDSTRNQSNRNRNTQSPPSPWRILGIEENASWAEIQSAYKEKIKQYHPDKLSHLGEEFSSLANEKFLEIQSAYTALKAKHRK